MVKDQVNGNRGNDELLDGKSRDVLKGGPGNDRAIWRWKQ